MRFLLSLCLSSLVSGYALAEQYRSTPQPAQLLELFTSEGCSSCPPADAWLSQLKSSPRLWREVVPIAYHVDYWDWLGWRDPYASAEYSRRQRDYQRYGLAGSVYTPGFFVQGQEWTGWFDRRPLPSRQPQPVGVLSAELDGQQMHVRFEPNQVESTPLQLTWVALGTDLSTQVKRGENRGRRLEHDFVVRYQQRLGHQSSAQPQWQITWPEQVLAQNQAFALWVSPANDPRPLQVLGGWLPQD